MIFEPYALKGLKLPNRVMRSATCEGMADARGLVTGPLTDLLARLSAGGVGLIVTGHCYVRRDGKATWGMTGIDTDDCLPGLQKLAAAVHAAGPAKIVPQLNHAGRQVPDSLNPAGTVAPSAVAQPNIGAVPRALAAEEVEALIDAYVRAAVRARAAGFDGVELHGAHGYLISQFLSPLVNRRQDAYGGTLENRARFLERIVKGIRQQAGEDFLLMIKLGYRDQDAAGLTPEDGLQVARWLARWGIDAIELSGGVGVHNTRRKINKPEEEAFFLPETAHFQAALPVPVISVGGYRSKKIMEKVIEDRRAAMIALCRPLIREPDLIPQFASGRKERADCISCSQCLVALGRNQPVKCTFV